ncbi:MAG: hypothetical protein AAGL68_10130 [Pseudomonadota bacterium]
MLEALKIIGFSILLAVIYGILHDQVTAHVSVEYFTVAHPPVFPTDVPFWLALGWGIIATWWVGLILGTILALSARFGRTPKLKLGDLKPHIIKLMILSALIAMPAGIMGWALTEAQVPGTIGFWDEVIEPSRQSRFAFAAWAHSASYLVGGIGGIVVALKAIFTRRKMAQAASASSINSG